MANIRTTRTRTIERIVEAASARGLDPKTLYHAVELNTDFLQDPDQRVAYVKLISLFERVAGLIEDDCLGLHLAETSPPGVFDILGYAASHSPTIGEAFKRIIRYYTLWSDGAGFHLELDNQQARLIYSITDPQVGFYRQDCEFTLAVILLNLRLLTGIEARPVEVRFQHAKPKNISEHQRIFKSPVRFARQTNELIFDQAVLTLPIMNADAGLCAVLERYAEEMLAKHPQPQGLLEEVRQLLSQELRGGNPSLATIAGQLRMSPRTLQRRLKDEGLSHKELLEEMRKELSAHYLRESNISTGEVAYLLGFSEPSAFHRAFRRWHSMTPKKFKQAKTLRLE
ncbi:MAG: AraC family transcriptional regulator [Acidobacteria bacterium]|nr:AraC family transcriptional regulator [Acidobacteriota bacterium]